MDTLRYFNRYTGSMTTPHDIIAQLAQLRDRNAERENRDNEHGRWEDWGLGYEQALTDIARLCGTDLEAKGRPQS